MPEFTLPSSWFDLTIIQYRGACDSAVSCAPIYTLYTTATNGDRSTGEGRVFVCFLFAMIAPTATKATTARTPIMATVASIDTSSVIVGCVVVALLVVV